MNKYIVGGITLLLLVGYFFYTMEDPDLESVSYSSADAEKAFEELQFLAKRPSYVPEEYQIGSVHVYSLEGQHRQIRVSYLDVNNSNGLEYTVAIGWIEGFDDSYGWKRLIINHMDGFLGKSGDETILMWQGKGIKYSVHSNHLTEEELIRIAKSVR